VGLTPFRAAASDDASMVGGPGAALAFGAGLRSSRPGCPISCRGSTSLAWSLPNRPGSCRWGFTNTSEAKLRFVAGDARIPQMNCPRCEPASGARRARWIALLIALVAGAYWLDRSGAL